MKYRVYRLIGRWEYKEVEAESPEAAEKHDIDPRNGFELIDDGLILWSKVDDGSGPLIHYSKLAEVMERKNG